VLVELFGGDLPGRSEDAERDRKVEAPALLRQLGGREVDRDAARRKLEPAVHERRAHAVLRLLHLGVGQADHREAREAVGEAGLDGGWRRLERGKGAAVQVHQRHCGAMVK
jgi:hypothetical protein